MSEALGAIARLFVAPAAGASDDIAATIDAALPAAVAIVGRDRRAIAAGCAAGLILARRARSPAALVCVRGAAPGTVRRATATLGARRLAAAVAAAGDPAFAAGRLAVVDVDLACADDDAGGPTAVEAAAACERALAAAGAAPTVLVLAGPREAGFDRLIEAQDAVGVACGPGDPPALAELALAGLPAGAVALRSPVARAAAALATSGVGVAPSLVAALAPLLEALP